MGKLAILESRGLSHREGESAGNFGQHQGNTRATPGQGQGQNLTAKPAPSLTRGREGAKGRKGNPARASLNRLAAGSVSLYNRRILAVRRNVMTTLELRLDLPDLLARDAAQMGLLEPDSLQSLLREAVRSRRVEKLAEARKRVAIAEIPPLSLDEIQAEVDAYRFENRAPTKS
jgi:hypothetical protein